MVQFWKKKKNAVNNRSVQKAWQQSQEKLGQLSALLQTQSSVQVCGKFCDCSPGCSAKLGPLALRLELISAFTWQHEENPAPLWFVDQNLKLKQGTPSPQPTNPTKADLHKGCIPRCWIWQITKFPCRHQFLITTIWLLIFFLVRKLYWNFAPEIQLISYITQGHMVKTLNCSRRN